MIKNEIINSSIKELERISGVVTEIERYAIHDGTGIRSVVFLKGCQLKCEWCCNPETQQNYIEMTFFKDRCIECGRCISACSFNAITVKEGEMIIDRSICRSNCFGKVEQFPCTLCCYSKARSAIGEKMNVLKVFKEIERDVPFYDATDGGLTISGGEPMFQPDFVYSLLRYCKEKWISTAIETSGAGSYEDYKKIAPYLDILFIDLKSYNTQSHIEWTKYDNTGILNNIEKLSHLSLETGFKLYVRIPIIPGFNSSEKEIYEIGCFIRDKCKGVQGIELLPYHKLGRGKYKSIGLNYSLDNLEAPTSEEMYKYNNILSDLGLMLYEF